MIKIIDPDPSIPFQKFCNYFKKAKANKDKLVDAMVVSTFNNNSPSSRFVNCKYLLNDEFIFFTNYNSPKSEDILQNKKAALLFYWHSINMQIRIVGDAKKTSSEFSDGHYKKRDVKKNAIAHSSNQSRDIKSFDEMTMKYQEMLSNNEVLQTRPDFWGGISIKPLYFEFWEGSEFRLNKRESFKLNNNDWIKNILQP